MKKTLKAILCIVLCSVMLFCITGCNKQENDKLVGKYVSENGKYTIEFKKDNTCVWYEEFLGTEVFFEGTYEKDGNNFKLFIKGDGFLTVNTTFIAEPVDNGLIITGGTCDNELFKKQ